MQRETISIPWRGCSSGRAIDWGKLVLLAPSNDPYAKRVRIGLIDISVVCLALAFPWSTTATGALALLAMLSIVITYGSREIIDQLKHPACTLPILFVGLAAVATMWAHGVAWPDRLHGLGKVSKLICFLPFFVHFQHTSRAREVFAAYVISNLFLLVLSFLVFFLPGIYSLVGAKAPGVPLKNYLDQSQAFVFVAVIMLMLAVEATRNQQRRHAIVFVATAVVFFVNLAFVNIARTAFIYLPAMLVLFIFRYVRGWSFLAALAGVCMLGVGAWAISPNLQTKMARLSWEVGAFQANVVFVNGYEAGGAERLEFWRKSIGFVRSAPILGHGTGATKSLFATEAAGQTGLMAKVIDNPHNQTLAVAIQWGAFGCLVLYAMWGSHLLLFREAFSGRQYSILAWIGLVAVVQNVVGSLLNSHLSDFYQGWLYLFVVAIVGGQLQRGEALRSNDSGL